MMNKVRAIQISDEATKIFKNHPSRYSLGYSRLSVLSSRTRQNFARAALLDGVDVTAVIAHQKSFLASLSEAQFVTWLMNNER